MALATYADLKAALGTWNIDRTDLPAADLVALAEARLNRDLRLRTMEAEAALTGAEGSRFVALPADFLEPLELWLELASGRQGLDYVPPEDLPNRPNGAQPQYWSVDGANLAFEAPLDAAYDLTLRYLQRFALSDGATTNWLLTNWPDAYLAAGNVEAALWLQDDEQAGRWQARYGEAVTDINAKESRSRAAATLRADPAIRAGAGGAWRFNINRGL